MQVNILSYDVEPLVWEIAEARSFVVLFLCINDNLIQLDFYDTTRFLQTLEEDQFFYLQDNVIILKQISKEAVYDSINSIIGRSIIFELKKGNFDTKIRENLVFLDFKHEANN